MYSNYIYRRVNYPDKVYKKKKKNSFVLIAFCLRSHVYRGDTFRIRFCAEARSTLFIIVFLSSDQNYIFNPLYVYDNYIYICLPEVTRYSKSVYCIKLSLARENIAFFNIFLVREAKKKKRLDEIKTFNSSLYQSLLKPHIFTRVF